MEFTCRGEKNENNEMNMKHDDSISLFSTLYRTPLDLYELGTINESSCVQITSKFLLFCSLEGLYSLSGQKFDLHLLGVELLVAREKNLNPTTPPNAVTID